MTCAHSMLRLTRLFWNANPCDGQADVARRMKFRYRKEPWLPAILGKVATHRSVLEIGCGQGTDALYCCERMKAGATYVGVDYSDESVASTDAACSSIGTGSAWSLTSAWAMPSRSTCPTTASSA